MVAGAARGLALVGRDVLCVPPVLRCLEASGEVAEWLKALAC
jgi:hypothetical protein